MRKIYSSGDCIGCRNYLVKVILCPFFITLRIQGLIIHSFSYLLRNTFNVQLFKEYTLSTQRLTSSVLFFQETTLLLSCSSHFQNYDLHLQTLGVFVHNYNREHTSFLSLIVLPFPTFGLIHWSQNADIKDLSLMVHDLECKEESRMVNGLFV